MNLCTGRAGLPRLLLPSTSNWKRGMESKYLSLPYLLLCSFQSSTSVPITDDKDCIIAVLAGHPDDVGWQQIHEEAAEALETLCEKLKDPSEKDLEN